MRVPRRGTNMAAESTIRLIHATEVTEAQQVRKLDVRETLIFKSSDTLKLTLYQMQELFS